MLPIIGFTLVNFLSFGALEFVTAQGARNVRQPIQRQNITNCESLSEPQHKLNNPSSLQLKFAHTQATRSPSIVPITLSTENRGPTRAITSTTITALISAVDTAAMTVTVTSLQAASPNQKPKGRGSKHPPTAGLYTETNTTTRAKSSAKPKPSPLTKDLGNFQPASPRISANLMSVQNSRSTATSSNTAVKPGSISKSHGPSSDFLRNLSRATLGPSSVLPTLTSLENQGLIGNALDVVDDSQIGDYRLSPTQTSGNEGIPDGLWEDLRNTEKASDSTALSTSFLKEYSLGGNPSISSSQTLAAANQPSLSLTSPDKPSSSISGLTNQLPDAPPILPAQSFSPPRSTTLLNLDGASPAIELDLWSSTSPAGSNPMSSFSGSSLLDDMSAGDESFLSLSLPLTTSTSSTLQPQGSTAVTLSVPNELTGITTGLSDTKSRPTTSAVIGRLDSESVISVTSSLSGAIGAGKLLLATGQLATQTLSTAIQTRQPSKIGGDGSNTGVHLSFLFESTSTTSDSRITETVTRATGRAPQLPESIVPQDGSQWVPEHKTLIQLGFNWKLPYRFVATNPLASSQIFLYVPQGLEYALQDASHDVSVLAIRPFDNAKDTGYVATAALAYIPPNQNKILQLMIHNPHSRLYEQPNKAIRTLFSMIDPSIPLGVDAAGTLSMGVEPSGGSGGGDSKSNGRVSDGSADGGASSSSQPRARSAGIAVGAVAGAIACGAGMFWIASRYQRRRQSHQRLGSDMDISAPVMTENSLGWKYTTGS